MTLEVQFPPDVPDDIRRTLSAFRQTHLLAHWEKLEQMEKEILVKQIRALNFKDLKALFEAGAKPPEATQAAEFRPPTRCSWDESSLSVQRGQCLLTRLADVPSNVASRWYNRGLDAIINGEVAAVMMAGGQGTRLGWDAPKGTFPIGAVSGRSLYQILTERVVRIRHLANAKRPGSPSPHLFVMTADHNHDATIAFYKEHDFFGLDSSNVTFFQQEVIPCFTNTGDLFLETRNSLACSPNGNGSIFRGLERSGALAKMIELGVKYIHVFGVDNALIKVLDPTFIGYVMDCDAEVGNKCAYKTDPQEKVGVMCLRKKKPTDDYYESCVVEYSDLPEAMRNVSVLYDKSIYNQRQILLQARDENGALQFCAGNICNHLFRLDFVRKILETRFFEKSQPHIAKKKIPMADSKTGERVAPAEPNGIKMEFFIFDCFTIASKVAGLEVPRGDDFAPVKNATGDDSPGTCRQMMTELYTKWLENCGWTCSGSGDLEISPLITYEGENLSNDLKPRTIQLPYFLAPTDSTIHLV